MFKIALVIIIYCYSVMLVRKLCPFQSSWNCLLFLSILGTFNWFLNNSFYKKKIWTEYGLKYFISNDSYIKSMKIASIFTAQKHTNKWRRKMMIIMCLYLTLSSNCLSRDFRVSQKEFSLIDTVWPGSLVLFPAAKYK